MELCHPYTSPFSPYKVSCRSEIIVAFGGVFLQSSHFIYFPLSHHHRRNGHVAMTLQLLMVVLKRCQGENAEENCQGENLLSLKIKNTPKENGLYSTRQQLFTSKTNIPPNSFKIYSYSKMMNKSLDALNDVRFIRTESLNLHTSVSKITEAVDNACMQSGKRGCVVGRITEVV